MHFPYLSTVMHSCGHAVSRVDLTGGTDTSAGIFACVTPHCCTYIWHQLWSKNTREVYGQIRKPQCYAHHKHNSATAVGPCLYTQSYHSSSQQLQGAPNKR